jgi:magnesium-transporting ATPase (P-type)
MASLIASRANSASHGSTCNDASMPDATAQTRREVAARCTFSWCWWRSAMYHVLAIRSERESTFAIGLFNNLPLTGAVALTVALQLALIYVPALNSIFNTDPLTWEELAVSTLVPALVFLGVEIEKWMVRMGWIYQATPASTNARSSLRISRSISARSRAGLQ